MKSIKATIASALIGTMAFGAAGAANAGSVTQPGEWSGVALGAALPEGVYAIDTSSIGGFRGVNDSNSSEAVTIPALVWATPYSIADAHISLFASTPAVSAGIDTGALPAAFGGGRDYTAMYNPAAAVGFAWNLGGGWGFAEYAGTYAPADAELNFLGHDIWVPFDRVALSYTANGWNLTATAIYGVTSDFWNKHGLQHPLRFCFAQGAAELPQLRPDRDEEDR